MARGAVPQRGPPQRRPASRDYYPGGGDEDMPPEPEEAWGDNRHRQDAPQTVRRNAGAGSSTTADTPEEKLKLILYTPACSMDVLAKKLQVSVVMGPSARVAQGGFVTRYRSLYPPPSDTFRAHCKSIIIMQSYGHRLKAVEERSHRVVAAA